MESIEEMEEFFLSLFFIGEELHIIHDKGVVLAVFVFETVGGTTLETIEIINRKALAGNVEHLLAWTLEVITHSLDEVGFTVASLSIDKKWIVWNTRLLTDCFGRSVSKGVEWANYEGGKCVAWIEVVTLVDVVLL